MKTLLAISILVLVIVTCSWGDAFLTITNFDEGTTKNGTATDTDEYGHAPGALELSFPYADRDANLVSYWRFENNADDETGANDGTVTGATYTANGKFGGAYAYDGNDNVQTSDISFSGEASEMTISAWARTDTVNSSTSSRR